MNKEYREIRWDSDLQIEAYRFAGIMQKFPNHFHDYYVIGFIEKGKRRLFCKNQEYTVLPGQLLLFNPGDQHGCEAVNGEALDYRCLNIKREVFERIVLEVTGQQVMPHFASSVVMDERITRDLSEIHQLIMEGASTLEKEERFYWWMKQLLEQQATALQGSVETVQHHRIKTVCQYMSDHLTEKLTLEQLAQLVHVSKYTLLRSFTETIGIAPYRYLQALRVAEAKKRLEEGERPSAVAVATGFVDQSHLNKLFTELIGFTPGKYRTSVM